MKWKVDFLSGNKFSQSIDCGAKSSSSLIFALHHFHHQHHPVLVHPHYRNTPCHARSLEEQWIIGRRPLLNAVRAKSSV
jgi:hypothetical protein